MALLPDKPKSQTVEAIYSWWTQRLGRVSRRLGASQIGQECERRLWYSFRWAPMGESFDGRMLRLFNRGHREEPLFVEELRGIGCQVHDTDPSTGEQFTFTAVGGHFVAKIDGVGLGIPEAPKTWHNLSFKTINAKGHGALVKNGVQKEKPENWAQNQIEMRLSSLTRTLYLSACKDDDSLYGERIHYDAAEAERLEQKAERVIFSPEPLPGISTDPAFYKCKFCPASAVCHTTTLPAVSCRTCLHATPERDGDGRWSCAKYGADIPLDAQRRGCSEHLYIPALLKRWGEATDASAEEGWVEYTAADGFVFRNGPRGVGCFESAELAAASPAEIRDEELNKVRLAFAGRFIEHVEMGVAA
jgi:hypothetical protein